MKPHIISAAFALMALSAGSALAATDEAPLTEDDELTLACFDLEVGYMMDIDNGLSVDSLYGGTIGTSYIFDATKSDFHKIGFSIGIFYGSDTYQYQGVDQKNTQQIVPVMINYAYHRNISDKCTAYVGARAGAFISKTQQKYAWASDFKLTHTRVAPTVGVDFGVEYEVSEKCKWNFGVRFDLSAALIQESPLLEQEYTGSVISDKDVVSATIHTGISYSF